MRRFLEFVRLRRYRGRMDIRISLAAGYEPSSEHIAAIESTAIGRLADRGDDVEGHTIIVDVKPGGQGSIVDIWQDTIDVGKHLSGFHLPDTSQTP